MSEIHVMVSGLPGKMATRVAEHVARSPDMMLMPVSFTGPDITEDAVDIEGGPPIDLVKPGFRDSWGEVLADGGAICVDYTQPSAVNCNAEFYCANGLNFVMGTTGGDREKLTGTVRDSKSCAVIAPNMASPIIVLQAMMEHAAQMFPEAFKGYKLRIRESHQTGKADTSGTAKAMVAYFSKLGIPFKPEQIVMVRDPAEQLRMGVPGEHLGGHGWHTYSLESEDGTVAVELTHNVNGRDVYALGTLSAIRYLDRKVRGGERGKVYSMIDVLKG